MNSKENSTALTREASALLTLMDKRDGLLAKSQAARHLAVLLEGQLTSMMSRSKAAALLPGEIETTSWLMSELYRSSQVTSELVDELLSGLEDLVERLK